MDSLYCQGFGSVLPIITSFTDLGVFSIAPNTMSINATTGEININSGQINTDYTISYITNSLKCSTSYSDKVKIKPTDNANFNYGSNVLCPVGMLSPNFEPTTVLGGTFSVLPLTPLVINSTTGELDLSTGVDGSCFNIRYITPAIGCQNSHVQNVCFQLSDEASFSYPATIVCDTNYITPILNTNTVSGGAFSSKNNELTINATTGALDLESTPFTKNYIIYYTTPSGVCQTMDSTSIEIYLYPKSISLTINKCEEILDSGFIKDENIRQYDFDLKGQDSTIKLRWYYDSSYQQLLTGYNRKIYDGEIFYPLIYNDSYCYDSTKFLKFNIKNQLNAGKNTTNKIFYDDGEINLTDYLTMGTTSSGEWANSSFEIQNSSNVQSFNMDKRYFYLLNDSICPSDTSIHNFSIIGDLTFPTTFTPNGDGVNDFWYIVGLSDMYPNCDVKIFSRWGELVYSSPGYNVPWNGKREGKSMPSATYYAIIDLGNGEEIIKRTVTIIR